MARRFTAVYQPYTFDELMKPVDRYNAEYDKQQAQLDELLDQSALMDGLDRELDENTYNLFAQQREGLENLAAQMNETGLNPSTWQQIYNLKRNQKTAINPRIDVYNERQNLIKEQRALGPDYIFDRNYATTPIDQMMTGVNTYNSYNLAQAEASGMTSGKAISSRVFSNPELAADLRNQYFRIREGIPADGRTMDQIFNEYPELQEDFDRWYSSSFDGRNFNQQDLDAARARYLTGVARGLVYDEKLVNNADHMTPSMIEQRSHNRFMEGVQLEQLYGPLGDDGNRHKDIGNGIQQITTPNSSSPTGWGQPQYIKSDGTPLTAEQVVEILGQGQHLGKDINGNDVYSDGRRIITRNPAGEIIDIRNQTNNNDNSQFFTNSLNGGKKDYSAFQEFNFDLNQARGTFKPNYLPAHSSNTGNRHHRSTTENALAHGYEEVDVMSLPERTRLELIQSINSHFSGANLELSDLRVIREPESGTGDDHYRVTLKPEIITALAGGGTPSGTDVVVNPRDLNASLQNTDSIRNAAANRFGGQP